MPRTGWWIGLILLMGCHGPSVVVSRPVPRPTLPAAEIELPSVTPSRIEPVLDSLPALDAKTVDAAKLFAANSAGFRGLNESACRLLAARHSRFGNLLDRENETASIQIRMSKHDCPDQSREKLLRELRYLAAREARHRDAAEALDRFYQLADAEARTELLTKGLQSFDEMRGMAAKIRGVGLPIPDEDELTRQRSKLLGEIEAAEAGIQLLNVELQSRLGLPVKGTERLWPTGSFEIPADAIDPEDGVRIALESRTDLQLLRALYHGINAETLPVVREQLKTIHALTGAAASPIARAILRKRSESLAAQLRSASSSEIELRKQQLYELIAEREKTAAAEVRTAVLQMASASRRVALAKGRAESWKVQVDRATQDGKAYDRLLVEFEWYKARADVVQEVMAWHRWHARYRAALGTLLLDLEPEKKS